MDINDIKSQWEVNEFIVDFLLSKGYSITLNSLEPARYVSRRVLSFCTNKDKIMNSFSWKSGFIDYVYASHYGNYHLIPITIDYALPFGVSIIDFPNKFKATFNSFLFKMTKRGRNETFN